MGSQAWDDDGREVLVIKESEWGRGLGPSESFLLGPGGMKCCLGFDALRRGASETECKLIPMPFGDRLMQPWFGLMSGWTTLPRFNQSRMDFLAHVNDLESIDDETRKSWIAAAFLAWGNVRVEFVP